MSKKNMKVSAESVDNTSDLPSPEDQPNQGASGPVLSEAMRRQQLRAAAQGLADRINASNRYNDSLGWEEWKTNQELHIAMGNPVQSPRDFHKKVVVVEQPFPHTEESPTELVFGLPEADIQRFKKDPLFIVWKSKTGQSYLCFVDDFGGSPHFGFTFLIG